MPNKLSQFWQELKRRKVIHVIIVYASAAFVIIELANNVTEPLRLPEWTPTLLIIILLAGFPLAVIFSWIYDITSKGITKTEKAIKVDQSGTIANSIAVLPFQDMSLEKDQEYFCDGIAEEIINALAHVSNLKVIARTSAFAFKNQNLDMREIGHALNVETLLEGSIRKDSNRIRIIAQLIKTDDGTHLWSERFDRDLHDIFAIQDEISLSIVDNLKIRLVGEEKSAILKRPTKDFKVYDLYLKATQQGQLATPQGFEKAIEYLGRALEIDPNFAPGYATMGGIYQLGAFYGNMPPSTGYPKAKELAKKVLEMDSTSPTALQILGAVSMFYDWDLEEAEKHLKYSQQINPNDEWAHHLYSQLLKFRGYSVDAISEAERAVELDPLSAFFSAELGFIYFYSNRFEEGIHLLKQTIEKFPNFYMGHWYLGMGYRCVSKTEEAIVEYRKAVELSDGIPMVISFLANALYETGRMKESEELIQSLEKKSEKDYVPAICFTTHYRFKGDHEKLYYWVERAIQQHDTFLPFNIVCPIKEYRIPDEPRYAELMEKVGLKQYFRND